MLPGDRAHVRFMALNKSLRTGERESRIQGERNSQSWLWCYRMWVDEGRFPNLGSLLALSQYQLEWPLSSFRNEINKNNSPNNTVFHLTFRWYLLLILNHLLTFLLLKNFFFLVAQINDILKCSFSQTQQKLHGIRDFPVWHDFEHEGVLKVRSATPPL